MNMDFYQGVKFGQVLDAIYEQGIKDGRNQVFEGIAGSVKILSGKFPHKNPGRPKKSK